MAISTLLARALAVSALGASAVMLGAAPAHAAEGSIDHVERDGDTVRVLFSLPEAGDSAPDFESLTVSLNDQAYEAQAELAADAEEQIRRTTVLAMDVSQSMQRQGRFDEAKAAAKAFLAAAPDDVYVGIVIFANGVTVAQPPSLDRAESDAIIDGLSLSRQTSLHDGLIQAVEATGSEGSRSVLLLSDGRDTTETPLDDVISAIEASDVRTDVIALGLSPEDTAVLEQFTRAGNGTTINADDPQALTELFTAEAESLASQVLVTFAAPAAGEPAEGTLAVSLEAGGEAYVDSAFVNVSSGEGGPVVEPSTDLVAPEPRGLQISRELMLGGIVAAGLGALLLVLAAAGGLRSRKDSSVEDRIAAYTRRGSRKLAAERSGQQQGMTAQAVGIAEKALEGREGLASALGTKLDAAGMSIKPAEWLLAHATIAFLAGLAGLLLSSGNIIYLGAGLLLGLALPWAYLSIKRRRRVKAFKFGLADTLQLMAGSLSAGLSLAQSVDTVVREGQEPIAGEFRRAIMESRLGVEIEDAMDGVADRMESVDFHWVVMAIRIQREVGGNLSELLNSVAATIREREYLERQVLALSAEGRLSVWILGGLPPGFMLYLLVANPEYLGPLISTTIGYIMLGTMAVLLTVGILWMKKLVKVDV